MISGLNIQYGFIEENKLHSPAIFVLWNIRGGILVLRIAVLFWYFPEGGGGHADLQQPLPPLDISGKAIDTLQTHWLQPAGLPSAYPTASKYGLKRRKQHA